jgi:hypothetical protein
MSYEVFTHATGLVALALNVWALIGRCDVAMRRHSIVAGCLWTVNNALLGAAGGAALSAVSVSRNASSAIALERSRVARRNTFVFFAALTLAAAGLTWHGWVSAFTLTASLMSTYAMFYMRGAPLRLVMLLVSALWMVHAWQLDSLEQMAANVLTAAAAAYGAWQVTRSSRPAA